MVDENKPEGRERDVMISKSKFSRHFYQNLLGTEKGPELCFTSHLTFSHIINNKFCTMNMYKKSFKTSWESFNENSVLFGT